MKRDAFDLGACDLHPALEQLPASEMLVQQALANWIASLRSNGNQLSPDHQHAGRQLLRALVDQLYGMYTGRYAYAVPCGGGKTQAVVALLTAMFALRVFSSKTVLVVAQQVDALCKIKQQLVDSGIPERAVGIVHSKTAAALKRSEEKNLPTFQSTEDEKRPIMLVTHSRVQRDGFLPDCCRNRHGSLHDLVIWDEALISTEAVCLNLALTVTALSHFADLECCPTVAEARQSLKVALRHERASQDAGQPASELTPLITEQQADRMESELRAVGYLDRTALALRNDALDGVKLLQNPFSLIDPHNGQSAGLMRYVVKVPDELTNIAILDASHAIDELRQADRSILSGTTEAMTSFKDFGLVTAIHYPLASGRSRIQQDGKAFDQAVMIANGLPHTEPVLFVTYIDWHEKKLAQALRDGGVQVDRKLPDGKPWLRIITWGSHTSDNSHTHCKHVVLVGLLRLPLLVTAAQLVAQKRDLTHRRDKTGLLSLERSVVAGNVMQAMNRGCMRLTDAGGMAHPMNAHIIAKDDLQSLLKKAMPGLVWKTAAVKEPTRTEEAARQIVEYLMAFPQTEPGISTRRLYADCGISPGKDLRASALAEALIRLAVLSIRKPEHRWAAVGRSLKRRPLE